MQASYSGITMYMIGCDWWISILIIPENGSFLGGPPLYLDLPHLLSVLLCGGHPSSSSSSPPPPPPGHHHHHHHHHHSSSSSSSSSSSTSSSSSSSSSRVSSSHNRLPHNAILHANFYFCCMWNKKLHDGSRYVAIHASLKNFGKANSSW